MDIVLQGPLDKYALEVAEYYLKCDFVEDIIISCWENDTLDTSNPRIRIIKNKDLHNPGIGNRNRQIHSSLTGLMQAKNGICAKMRTDQKVTISSLHLMRDFFELFKQPTKKYEDGDIGPAGKVFVTSLFTNYPFHPRDHIFWGYQPDLIDVFNIPMCPLLPYPSQDDGQYVFHTRAETYIGAYYYAKFDKDIYKFIDNPQEYLIDNAPKRQEAMDKYFSLGEHVFKTFPPIQMEWPKRGQKFYPYYGFNPHGEIWDETPWRMIK